jgi:hypothetical protein
VVPVNSAAAVGATSAAVVQRTLLPRSVIAATLRLVAVIA